MAWVSQVTFRRARQDGDNDGFFSTIKPAGWKDHAFVMWVISAFVVAGTYLLMSGGQGWFALLALIVAIVALATQLYSTDRFWRRSMAALED